MLSTIQKIPAIGPRIANFYLRIRKNFNNPAYWVAQVIPQQHAQIIQIGANDGVHGDHVYGLLSEHPDWSALFVEAVPYLCERLKKNYSDRLNCRFRNVAINHGEKGVFYWVDPMARESIRNLPEFFDQLGSFNRSHICKHLDGILEPFIREMEVQGVRLTDLLEQEGVSQVDFLNIDTEGYDWKILSQLDTKRYRPAAILYEHTHLAEGELEESIKRLRPDYYLYDVGRDVFAVCRDRGRMMRIIVSIMGRRCSLVPIA